MPVSRKKDASPENLLFDFEMAFAKTMNYPKNKQHQAELIRYEKEMLRRLDGSYAVFCKCDQLPSATHSDA